MFISKLLTFTFSMWLTHWWLEFHSYMYYIGFYGVMISTLDFESSDPSSNLGRTYVLRKTAKTQNSWWSLLISVWARKFPQKIIQSGGKNGIMWGGKSRAHTQFFWSRKSEDEVAEWLRRWTANPLGSARVGSNPILVGSVLWCNG